MENKWKSSENFKTRAFHHHRLRLTHRNHKLTKRLSYEQQSKTKIWANREINRDIR